MHLWEPVDIVCCYSEDILLFWSFCFPCSTKWRVPPLFSQICLIFIPRLSICRRGFVLWYVLAYFLSVAPHCASPSGCNAYQFRGCILPTILRGGLLHCLWLSPSWLGVLVWPLFVGSPFPIVLLVLLLRRYWCPSLPFALL